MNRSAGILPAYDVESPAMAKSKPSTNRNPDPPSRPQAGAPSGSGVQSRNHAVGQASRLSLILNDRLEAWFRGLAGSHQKVRVDF